jgi:phenylpropionate dioxygenase-like ring-hydroxylating dioxygenase large terminal subunit
MDDVETSVDAKSGAEVARRRAHVLTGRIAERISTGTTDESLAPETEDVADFLSPERFALERERLFLDTPQVIGFAGEVAQPGQFITAEVMGIPIVVTRAVDGELHALINACAHRGARVARGRGTVAGRRLRCGFHGWTFGLDGRLASRPQEDCFDEPNADCDLTPLPVSDRLGLVVVGLRPEMSQARVDEHLAGLEPELSGLGFEEARNLEVHRYEVAASWKLVSMLSYESYHFAALHRETVATMFESNAITDFFGHHSRWGFALKGTDELAQSDSSSWPEHFPGTLNYQIFPGTVLITTPEIAQLIRSEPGPTPGTSVVHTANVYFDESKREELIPRVELGQQAFEQEDLPAAIEVQQGLAAGRRKFFVGTNEPVVQFWLRQWREAVGS